MGMGQAKKVGGRGNSIIPARAFLVENVALDQWYCKSIITRVAACISCAVKELMFENRILEMQQ
jgi:hypothetical protein